MRCFFSFMGILLMSRLATAQTLCDIAHQPSQWKEKRVSVTTLLSLTNHDGALIPIGEPLGYRGECALFPLLPGTPPFLSAGVSPKPDSRRSSISRTMRAYRAHLDSTPAEDWCFEASGVVKVINNYNYNQQQHKGNGFGYKGYYRIALLIEDLEKTTCPQNGR
jgi:hypothetical protein